MNEKNIKYSFTKAIFDDNDNTKNILNSQSFDEIIVNGRDWVNYGKDNLYPEYLWNLYVNSSTHSAIIDGKVDYVIGEGLVSGDKEKVKKIKKSIFDYILYGGFAIQVIYNNLGEISKVQPLDFSRCRVNQNLTKIYYSPKWKKSSGVNVLEFYTFGNTPIDEVKTSEIYYFRGNKTRGVYPIPSYVGSTKSIETSIEIQNYHLNAIKNNFCVSTIITFIGDPTEDEKTQLNGDIKENFTGSDNASQFMLMYADNKDETPIVTRLESNKADERFEKLSKDTKENIFIGHRVVSGALFGLVSESTGFNDTEYQEVFKLFNKTVIQPIQNIILDSFNEIYGVEDEIIPFIIPEQTQGKITQINIPHNV